MALELNITVLIGGVGGAKLARGLVEVVPPPRLSFIVNTGDDFWRYGLKICPDLDTVMYTLADIVNPETGWGLAADSSAALDSMARLYGVDNWFRLGDKDLATHLLRTQRLREGESLSQVTAHLSRQLGISARILPMTDAEVPTILNTINEGTLPFQDYFVRRRCAPIVQSIMHKNAERAAIPERARAALLNADALLIAPSNPWLSIAPILSVPGMRALLSRVRAPVIAVTPIIGGEAVKGPTAKIMRELGLRPSAAAVAEYYQDILDGFVNDSRNPPMELPGVQVLQSDTLMRTLEDKIRLAQEIVHWIEGWLS